MSDHTQFKCVHNNEILNILKCFLTLKYATDCVFNNSLFKGKVVYL